MCIRDSKQTGPVDPTDWIDAIRPGKRMKFSNSDKVYRIGLANFGRKKGPRRNSQTMTFVDIRFENEDGTEQKIHNICTPGDNHDPDFLTATLMVEKEPGKVLFTTNPAIFETEPIDNKTELNLYFEASDNYDCLLYTSPSPRDLSTSRMPSSA